MKIYYIEKIQSIYKLWNGSWMKYSINNSKKDLFNYEMVVSDHEHIFFVPKIDEELAIKQTTPFTVLYFNWNVKELIYFKDLPDEIKELTIFI